MRAAIPSAPQTGLSRAARQALPDTLSENTKRVYRSALRALNERLQGRCVCDGHLSEVLAEMSAEGLSASALRLAVAAVNKEAELAGAQSPCGKSTTTVLRAHARKAPSPRQATSVDWPAADLAAALSTASGICPVADSRTARWWPTELPVRGQQNCPGLSWSVASPPCRRWLG